MIENSAEKLEAATVDERGVPVEMRITTIEAAREIYEDLKESQEIPARRRARIQGLIDGNPPYEQAMLDDNGLGFMTNVNFLEARAILDQKAATHYELFFEVPTLVELKFTIPGLSKDDKRVAEVDVEKVVSEEFSQLLLRWPGFTPFMDKVRRQTDAHGYGPALFLDEWDWRPKAFNAGSFLFDADAEIELDSLQIATFRDRMFAGDIFRRILENPEQAKAEGWNVEQVKKTLLRVYKLGTSQSAEDQLGLSPWEALQQKFRNSDWTLQRQEFEKVPIVYMLVKEPQGGVSLLVFDEEDMVPAQGSDVSSSPPSQDDFLFIAPKLYRNMREAMWILPYNFGDGYLRSLRGLGSMIEPHVDVSNRFIGRMIDAGFMSASMMVQPESPGDVSKLQLIRMGPVTVLPHGLKAMNSAFAPQIGGIMQIRDLSSSIMRNNTGVFRIHSEVFAERQAEKTARQVTEEVAREARMEKSTIAFDYEHFERLYREIWRRVTRADYLLSEVDYPGKAEARDFIRRCSLRGVPADYIMTEGVFDLYVTRAIGMGSWGVKLDLTNQILGAAGRFPGSGQKHALRDWLGARVGYRNVDRYAPLSDPDNAPTNQTALAAMENNQFLDGYQLPVGSDQHHEIHAQSHAMLLAEIVEGVKKGGEGMDLEKAFNALSGGIPHTASHLFYLQQDPAKAELALTIQKQVLPEAQKVAKQLQALLQQQAEARAQAEQERAKQVEGAVQGLESAQAQLKTQEAQNKFVLEMTKQASLNEARRIKTAEQGQIRRDGFEQDSRLKEERHAAELRLEAEKVRAKIELDRQKTEAKTTQGN